MATIFVVPECNYPVRKSTVHHRVHCILTIVVPLPLHRQLNPQDESRSHPAWSIYKALPLPGRRCMPRGACSLPHSRSQSVGESRCKMTARDKAGELAAWGWDRRSRSSGGWQRVQMISSREWLDDYCQTEWIDILEVSVVNGIMHPKSVIPDGCTGLI